ncbi:Hypothetical protein A7982_07743 [Minicystis rosea]|nr:Hypothetical protein A7982_07743 [Minicystis rosea]
MKKFALVAVVFSMLAGLVGCGSSSSACDDYAAKAKECGCASLTDATAKAACEKQIDDAVAAYGDAAEASCEAAATALAATCPTK